MKKLALMLALVLSMSGVFASAEAVSSRELMAMDNPDGMALRFLQLERQIDVKIDRANLIIDRIRLYNDSINTTSLEEIVDEMRIVREEVANHTDPNASANLSDEVIAYIDLKRHAMSLVLDFRKELNRLVKDENFIGELRNRVKAVDKQKYAEINKRIRTMIRRYNAYRLKWVLRKMNVNPSAIEKVKSGNITRAEAIGYIRQARRRFNKTALRRISWELKQNLSRKKIDAQAISNRAFKNYTLRELRRINSRLDRIDRKLIKLNRTRIRSVLRARIGGKK